jgi:hypothetical protein
MSGRAPRCAPPASVHVRGPARGGPHKREFSLVAGREP